MKAAPDPLLLLTALSRALSHRMRTPLSTLSNEIFCLKKSLPPDDWERLQRPLQRMIDLLKELPGSLDVDTKQEPISLRDLLGSPGDAIVVTAHRASLTFVIQAISRLLTTISLNPVPPTLEQTSNGSATITWQSPVPKQLALSGPQQFNSLTDLFFKTLSLDEFSPPLIDALISKNGWELVVMQEKGEIVVSLGVG